MTQPTYTADGRCLKRGAEYIAILSPGVPLQEAAQIAAKLEAFDKLVAALKGLIPVARACKHEDFSTLDGKESTKTEKLAAAIAALELAKKAGG